MEVELGWVLRIFLVPVERAGEEAQAGEEAKTAKELFDWHPGSGEEAQAGEEAWIGNLQSPHHQAKQHAVKTNHLDRPCPVSMCEIEQQVLMTL